MSSERSIIPPTSKITVRGPVASSAARNDPAPASLRFVTRRIAPPRPAGDVVPNPAAPGKTGKAPATGRETSCPRHALVRKQPTSTLRHPVIPNPRHALVTSASQLKPQPALPNTARSPGPQRGPTTPAAAPHG